MRPKVHESKHALRQQVCRGLEGMTAAQRAADSARARALLAQQAIWRQARSILFYAPFPEELDVWPLVQDSLAAGKTVALPRFQAATKEYVACRILDASRDIVSGHFGIREPADHCVEIPREVLEWVLVPGVAFDERGHRLGRGKGYYDRLLAPVRGTTCGVAFNEQLVPEIPVEPHDVMVSCVLTPTRWIEV
jgi:5-formyltetrahydrofolate cyclo-ligase